MARWTRYVPGHDRHPRVGREESLKPTGVDVTPDDKENGNDVTKGPHLRNKTMVCRNCNTEFAVSKSDLLGCACPECRTPVRPPRKPNTDHIKIITD